MGRFIHLSGQTRRLLSDAAGSTHRDVFACLKETRAVIRLAGDTLVHFLQVFLEHLFALYVQLLSQTACVQLQLQLQLSPFIYKSSPLL